MRKIIVLFLIFASFSFGLIGSVNGASDHHEKTDRNDILEKWKEMDKTVTRMAGSAIKMILPQIMESAGQLNISSQCMGQTMQLISGIRRLKIWAFKFIDSSTKIMDGMLSGTFSSTGDYEQCLKATAESKDPNKPLFKGQYCQVNIKPPLPHKNRNYKYGEGVEELKNFTGSEVINFLAENAGLFHSFPYKIGLCVPSGCNEDEIGQFVRAITENFYVSTSVGYCEVKKDIEFSPISIFAIVLCVCLCLIVMFGTALDLCFDEKDMVFESIVLRIFLTFSVVRNSRKLFDTKPSVKQLECINGIRFLAITMVVLGHSYFYPVFLPNLYHSLLTFHLKMKEPMGQMIINTHVVVDTFFFVSGFLISYILIKGVKIEKNKFNVTQYIFHRLWRIAPVYYFILLVSMLSEYMGSGPAFKKAMAFSVDNCYKYWWRNILFINNFFNFHEMCFIHTWYVSCDFQLYLATLIVYFPLIRSKTIGIGMSIFIILTSVIYTGVITYTDDLVPGLQINYLDQGFQSDTFVKTYANLLTHAGPYFLGVLVGYTVVTQPDIKMTKKCQVIGWLLAVLFSGYTMFWTALWKHYTPTRLESSVYAGLYRTTWASAVAWMTFCCTTGYGGFINKFLSWSPWVPLAKFSFLIYLIQPTLQTMYIAIFKTLHEISHFELVVIYFGLLLMSGLLALLANLIIESPVLALEKLLLTKKENKEVDLPVTANKYGNGDVHIENKNETELHEFTNGRNGLDNRAYDRGA